MMQNFGTMNPNKKSGPYAQMLSAWLLENVGWISTGTSPLKMSN